MPQHLSFQVYFQVQIYQHEGINFSKAVISISQSSWFLLLFALDKNVVTFRILPLIALLTDSLVTLCTPRS